MLSTTFVSLLALSATAFGASTKNTCNAGDVKAVKQHFKHPVIACDFFLATKYQYVPVPSLSSAAFSNACQCITGKKASSAAPQGIKNPGAAPTCNANAKAAVAAEVPNPSVFCNFWLNTSWRSSSPFLNVRQIYNGCRCYHPVAAATTTKKAATTTPAKPTTTAKSATTTVSKPASKSSSSTSAYSKPASSSSSTTVSSKPASSSSSATVSSKPASSSSSSASVTVGPVYTSSSAATTTASSTSMDASAANASPTATLKFAKRYNSRSRHARV